jgi:hypothetical protein
MSTKKTKIINESETEPISTRSVVQLTMATKGAHSRGSLFVRKYANWSHCPLHYTHISPFYTVPGIVGDILQSRETEHNLFLPTVFSLYF